MLAFCSNGERSSRVWGNQKIRFGKPEVPVLTVSASTGVRAPKLADGPTSTQAASGRGKTTTVASSGASGGGGKEKNKGEEELH